MAAIEPNIALGVKPIQIENPMNQYAALSQLQANQNQNALAQYQLSAAQRADEAQNVQNQLYAKHYNPQTGEVNKAGLFADLSQNPNAAGLIPKLQTQFTELEQKANLNKKTALEASGLDFKQRLEKANKAISDIAALNSPQDALAGVDRHLAAGDIDQAKADLLRQSITKAPDFKTWQKTTLLNILDAKDRLVTEETQRHNAKTENISAGNLGVAQAQLNIAKQNQQLLYGKDVVANTVTDNAGNVTQFNRFGEVIGKPGAIGKPSATFEKTTELRKQQNRDLGLAITELENATKDGGLIDKSTGSGAGRLADVAAGFVGQATPGAIAIAKLKPIADIALKMVPRFEGPQSDKDTASYKEAAGQLADPSLPTQIRKEAGKEVLRLMKARKGQFVNEVMANEGIGAGGVDMNNPLLNLEKK